ncbi:putative Double zinc ribbon-containing protein [Homarus americanus]|uniref:Putative Double zinc ribbon-containing protein n=1 Tax=Homarus americanus TaxID=6706 RepID=A0A8J5JPH7_HOMAM|nr:putative Double zinc ribbon-containing protein [Homarus americanus]
MGGNTEGAAGMKGNTQGAAGMKGNTQGAAGMKGNTQGAAGMKGNTQGAAGMKGNTQGQLKLCPTTLRVYMAKGDSSAANTTASRPHPHSPRQGFAMWSMWAENPPPENQDGEKIHGRWYVMQMKTYDHIQAIMEIFDGWSHNVDLSQDPLRHWNPTLTFGMTVQSMTQDHNYYLILKNVSDHITKVSLVNCINNMISECKLELHMGWVRTPTGKTPKPLKLMQTVHMRDIFTTPKKVEPLEEEFQHLDPSPRPFSPSLFSSNDIQEGSSDYAPLPVRDQSETEVDAAATQQPTLYSQTVGDEATPETLWSVSTNNVIPESKNGHQIHGRWFILQMQIYDSLEAVIDEVTCWSRSINLRQEFLRNWNPRLTLGTTTESTNEGCNYYLILKNVSNHVARESLMNFLETLQTQKRIRIKMGWIKWLTGLKEDHQVDIFRRGLHLLLLGSDVNQSRASIWPMKKPWMETPADMFLDISLKTKGSLTANAMMPTPYQSSPRKTSIASSPNKVPFGEATRSPSIMDSSTQRVTMTQEMQEVVCVCGSQKRVREKSKFCQDCGTKISTQCPSCQETVPLRYKYCDSCGSSLNGAPDNLPAPISTHQSSNEQTHNLTTRVILQSSLSATANGHHMLQSSPVSTPNCSYQASCLNVPSDLEDISISAVVLQDVLNSPEDEKLLNEIKQQHQEETGHSVDFTVTLNCPLTVKCSICNETVELGRAETVLPKLHFHISSETHRLNVSIQNNEDPVTAMFAFIEKTYRNQFVLKKSNAICRDDSWHISLLPGHTGNPRKKIEEHLKGKIHLNARRKCRGMKDISGYFTPKKKLRFSE